MHLGKVIGFGLVVLVSSVPALGDIIINDTYIDNYDPRTTNPLLPQNGDVNYGGSAAVKVVSSGSTDSFPNSPSAVRTLLTLPDSFWNAIGANPVASATITLRVRNFNNNVAFTRTVGAYPLLQGFKAGTGFQPTIPGGTIPSTQGGTQNVAGNPVAADWNTADGITPWSTIGGTFDAADGVNAAISTSPFTTLTWDITKFINNQGTSIDTRAAIHNFGLLLKITDDFNYPAQNTQQFLSFYSYEGALTQGSPAAFYPVVNFTAVATVPEPGAVVILGMGVVGGLMRRGRRSAR